MKRSDLLAHWSGKDIELDIAALDGEKRRSYKDRLKSILLGGGFWMTRPKESLIGHTTKEGETCTTIDYDAATTCFTELKLTGSRDHCSKYGLCSVVVRRSFVLERLGGPVLYVRNRAKELVVGSMSHAIQTSIELEKDLKPIIPEGSFDKLAMVTQLMIQHFSLLKGMSEVPPSGEELSADDFTFIDEHEWRIVQIQDGLKRGYLTRSDSSPYYKVPVEPEDLVMIVVPDGLTRESVFDDTELAQFIGRRPVLTLYELENL